MKIGINARFLTQPYTGTGQYTRLLLSALARLDSANEYFLFTPELVEWNLPDHFHQLRILEKPSYSLSLQKAHWEHVLVPQEMKKWKIDLAHFLYPSNPWARLPFPTIVTVHDVIPWIFPAYRTRWRSKLYQFYARHALKKADHVITPSHFSKKEIVSTLKVKEKNITVIPHGVPPAFPTLGPTVPLRRPFLLYVGGYDERKNVPRLIQAFLKYLAHETAFDLILVGGKKKGLESLITDEYAPRVSATIPVQPKGHIIFTDQLDARELDILYHQATLLVHPSLYEGFNLPVLEAMAAGLPVAAADIPVNREVTGEHAVFFDPLSIDSIGQTLRSLLANAPFQKILAQDAREKAREYRWEKSAEETLNVYNLFI